VAGLNDAAPVLGADQDGVVARAPKTAELIAAHLRRTIVRGSLPPGTYLPTEVELMEQYDVSRPTLREAFRILEADSLIGVRRGSRGGAQVLQPSPRVATRHTGLLLQLAGTTIADVYDARLVIEPACARHLALARTATDLDDLDACVRELRASLDGREDQIPSYERWTKLTYRFHQLVMERCGNRTLGLQGSVLIEIVATHAQLTVARGTRRDTDTPVRFRRTVRSYTRLVALVRAQDAEGAEEHWRAHMELAATYFFTLRDADPPVLDLFD